MPRSPNRSAAAGTTIPTRIGETSGAGPLNHKKRWRFWSRVCFAIGLVAAFARPLLALITYAAGSELYSYILLVQYYATDVLLTLVFLVVGAVLLAFTHSLDSAGQAFSGNSRIVVLTFSFLCCLAAGGFFFFGRRWMRAAAFPWAYLIFTVPMPDAMADALETASISASAEVANLLFHFSVTPFVRVGLVFQLPNIAIEVAQQCSGIRSSWVLFMTSILAANLFLKTPWRRFVLVALVIPLAILRNGFRILVIGLLCVNIGPQMIHSLIHRRGGPLFFVLSLIPFFLVLWWLRKGDVRSRQSE